mmetsp:Transcript_65143/g.135808  ORF Transcript_65143/g.135808 Transcript_65143/m.135808 type:complete len:215 (-) Transcript_65143:567-1211(-)
MMTILSRRKRRSNLPPRGHDAGVARAEWSCRHAENTAHTSTHPIKSCSELELLSLSLRTGTSRYLFNEVLTFCGLPRCHLPHCHLFDEVLACCGLPYCHAARHKSRMCLVHSWLSLVRPDNRSKLITRLVCCVSRGLQMFDGVAFEKLRLDPRLNSRDLRDGEWGRECRLVVDWLEGSHHISLRWFHQVLLHHRLLTPRLLGLFDLLSWLSWLW